MATATDSNSNTNTTIQSQTSANNTHATSNDASDVGGEYGNSHQVGIKISTQSTPSESIRARFERITLAIATDNRNPLPIFKTLKSICRKTLKNDVRYRTLDLQNPRVNQRLIDFEHVLNFLNEVGFKANEAGIKLICEPKPSVEVVKASVEVLSSFINRYDTGKMKSKIKSSMILMMDEKDEGNYNQDQNKNNSNNINGMLSDLDNISVIAQAGYEDEDDDNLSLNQIVIWCTHETSRDSESMQTLIVTHKQYCKSIDLLNTLRKRYFISAPDDIKNDKDKMTKWENDVCKRIRLKSIKGLKDWMKQYWNEDFKDNVDNIKDELKNFINEIKIKTPDLPFGKFLEIHIKKCSKNGGINSYTITTKLHPLAFDYDEIDWDSIKYDKKNYMYNVNSNNGINGILISPRIFADQITLLDFDTFRKIKPRECIGQAWKKKDNLQRAPNILKMIRQFNRLTTLCQIKILSQNSIINRARQISKVIEMGQRFYELNNINGLCAVFSCLNSAPLYTRDKEWSQVSPEDKQCFKEFQSIFDTGWGHRNLRKLQRYMETPAIPHIGIVLQDMVFIEDGNINTTQFSRYPRIMDRIKLLTMFHNDGYQTFDNDSDEKQDKKRDSDTDESVGRSRRVNLKPDLKIMKMLMDEFEIASKFSEDEIWNMRLLPNESNNGVSNAVL